MKFVIAPDSFKDSMSAVKFCDIAEKVILETCPGSEVIKLPVSDGGEGFASNLSYILDGEMIKETVLGPYGEPVEAEYLYLPHEQSAVVEMARASGLELVAVEKRDTKKASTYGTGQLIKAAIERGARKVIVGLGGSATTDAGSGMAKALGYEFYDSDGQALEPCGENLKDLQTIKMSPYMKEKLENIEFVAACDVQNPLYGPEGSAFVYARQKGASDQDILELDQNLKQFSKAVKNNLGLDYALIPGSGAAGGLGYGIMSFLNGKLESGIDIFLDQSGFEEKIADADWIITGEGKFDEQAFFGKTIYGVSQRAKKFNKKVIVLCGGNFNNDEVFEKLPAVKAFFSITQYPCELDHAINKTAEWLRLSLKNILKIL